MKKAAKFFAQKFATGASVTKNPQGLDEIVVQGDVSSEIVDMIEEGVGLLKNVPNDNIVEVEEKPRKPGWVKGQRDGDEGLGDAWIRVALGLREDLSKK